MFGSESDFDEQSGLLRNGKRYKRTLRSYILGQNTDYNSLIPEDSESEETPFVGNPPITSQRISIIPESPSQSESNPSLSSPVVDNLPP